MTKKKPPLVLLVGYKGNMGRRYGAILNHLNVNWIGTENFEEHQNELIQSRRMDYVYSHVIIATPTDTHDRILRLLHRYQGMVLCEKPLCKHDLIDHDTADGVLFTNYWPENLFMVNNYNHIYEVFRTSQPREHVMADNLLGNCDTATSYDYYNSGNDGLLWDCIQLLVLARGSVSLRQNSPIWEVKINNTTLYRGDIDRSYVSMIERFLDDQSFLWGANDPRVLRAHAIAHSYPDCGGITIDNINGP